MDLGSLDSKRPRLASWSGTTSQPTTLPLPHSTPHLPPPSLPQHPSSAGPAYQSYPPRHSDISSNHPSITSPTHGMPLQHPDVDRRHHDQEPLAPMHDHYRHPQSQQQQQPPPHSPAQPHYPSYSPSVRDTLIKREGLEDGRRPTSASHGLDGGHGPASHHQGPPPHPHAYPSEPQRHVSYEPTPQLPPTPGAYRHHAGPSTSMPPPPQAYEPQPAYQSSSDQIYSVYSSSNAVPVAKKKNTRASQACDSCRQLKAKCDETRPCKTCRDRGTECKYRDPPPKVADKTQSDILEGIALMQSQLTTLVEHFTRMDDRLTKIENSVLLGPAAATRFKAACEDQYKAESTSLTGEGVVKYPSQDVVRAGPDQTTLPEDEVETEPGPPPPPGEPAIPMNHTTPAGLLLNWPSIKELTRHHVEREGITYIGEYPISQEQNRGLLILYGRGEDNRMSRKEREREREQDQASVDMPDDSSDSPSPSTSTEAMDWGTLGGLSPYDHVDYRSGVLGPDGNPDFSEAKVWSYVRSFKENILNMHPIVQPPILDQWVRQFLESLPITTTSNKVATTTTAWALSTSVEATGSKRKRSPVPDSMDSMSAASPTRAGRPNRTIHTALILAVLALGKVCQHRDYVPDALHIGDPMPHGSLFQLNGIPQSPKGSPPGDASRSQSSSLVSPRDQDRSFQSRRSSLQGNPRSVLLKKNYENIPGLEYFAFATDILGNHLGSYNNMKNVYADIFAGLYQGQLGRPLESFAFIHRAGHKLQVIMRPSLEKLKRFKNTQEFIKDTKYNQLSLAFWTCLQLESDLIAELPVPPSGLLSYENDIPHPNMSLLEGFDKPVLDSYLGQLYLRTHLNSIHRMFYAPEDPAKGRHSSDIPFKNVDFVSDAVSGMQWVGPSFAFKEDDPPASDILSARLRAKYWGAQVLTYRPFLRQMLQFSHVKNHPTTGQPPSSEFRAEVEAPRIDPGARNVHDLDPHILVLARKAIKALIESTRAFHGLGEKRPIITSVFGTAHAQWGNLLVLSAAFKDPVMGEYIDEGLLRHLFHKTIAFLRQSATATSSLRIDMHILEGLQKDLFNIDPKYSNYAGPGFQPTQRLASNSMDMPPPRSTESEGTPQMPHNRLTPAPS